MTRGISSSRLSRRTLLPVSGAVGALAAASAPAPRASPASPLTLVARALFSGSRAQRRAPPQLHDEYFRTHAMAVVEDASGRSVVGVTEYCPRVFGRLRAAFGVSAADLGAAFSGRERFADGSAGAARPHVGDGSMCLKTITPAGHPQGMLPRYLAHFSVPEHRTPSVPLPRPLRPEGGALRRAGPRSRLRHARRRAGAAVLLMLNVAPPRWSRSTRVELL